MEYRKQGGAEDEFFGQKARFVKIMIFYAQDGTRSTCVKLNFF
jgi:hypothetical protein